MIGDAAQSESSAVTTFAGDVLVPPREFAGGAWDVNALCPPSVFAGASISQVLFSFAAMLGTCLVARMFFWLRSFSVDPDVWWHIKVGEGILATHHLPTADPYSFTVAGQQWVAFEWLGDVLLATVYRAGGLRGLGALLIILGSLFALALYYYTTIRCGNPKAGFLAAALLTNLANFSNLRPQMVGYLFLILTLIVLERFRQGKRGLVWSLPVMMVLWINVHGSWIVGLVAIGMYLASGLIPVRMALLESRLWSPADRRNLAVVFLLSAIATLITPYGAGLAKIALQANSSLPIAFANIAEWKSMAFNLPGDKLFLALVLGVLLAQVLVRPKWRVEDLGLFLFGTAMAFLHLRFLSLFVAFFAPVFAAILARWVPKYDRAKEIYALNAAIILGLVAAMVWYFPSRSDYARIVAKSFPVAAVDYLNTHSVPGPTYNSYFFGGYLIFSRGPENKVFIDGRGDIYESAGVFSDYVALANLQPGSLAVLQKYNIQSCLLSRGEGLATVLAELPGWRKEFEDDNAVLFVKQ